MRGGGGGGRRSLLHVLSYRSVFSLREMKIYRQENFCTNYSLFSTVCRIIKKSVVHYEHQILDIIDTEFSF